MKKSSNKKVMIHLRPSALKTSSGKCKGSSKVVFFTPRHRYKDIQYPLRLYSAFK